MKTKMVIYLLVLVCLCAITSAGYSLNTTEEITYPPKPKPTEIKEIVNSVDSLKANVKDLSRAVTGDIRKHGMIESVKGHKKFYGAIFVFGILSLIWLKSRRF